MARHDGLSQWTDCVSSNMPHLTKPQATVLALWSFGMACTRSCGRTTVATFLALLLREPLANLEQRLYEWCLDANSLGDRFVVLAVCVVYRGCGIPVAWTILPAGKKRAWRREWLRMLRLLRPAIPRAWTVLVLADGGLFAGWAGLHSCASIRAARSARWATPSSCGSATWWIRLGHAGAGLGRPLPRAPRGWTVRCWPGGATAIPNP